VPITRRTAKRSQLSITNILQQKALPQIIQGQHSEDEDDDVLYQILSSPEQRGSEHPLSPPHSVPSSKGMDIEITPPPVSKWTTTSHRIPPQHPRSAPRRLEADKLYPVEIEYEYDTDEHNEGRRASARDRVGDRIEPKVPELVQQDSARSVTAHTATASNLSVRSEDTLIIVDDDEEHEDDEDDDPLRSKYGGKLSPRSSAPRKRSVKPLSIGSDRVDLVDLVELDEPTATRSKWPMDAIASADRDGISKAMLVDLVELQQELLSRFERPRRRDGNGTMTGDVDRERVDDGNGNGDDHGDGRCVSDRNEEEKAEMEADGARQSGHRERDRRRRRAVVDRDRVRSDCRRERASSTPSSSSEHRSRRIEDGVEPLDVVDDADRFEVAIAEMDGDDDGVGLLDAVSVHSDGHDRFASFASSSGHLQHFYEEEALEIGGGSGQWVHCRRCSAESVQIGDVHDSQSGDDRLDLDDSDLDLEDDHDGDGDDEELSFQAISPRPHHRHHHRGHRPLHRHDRDRSEFIRFDGGRRPRAMSSKLIDRDSALSIGRSNANVPAVADGAGEHGRASRAKSVALSLSVSVLSIGAMAKTVDVEADRRRSGDKLDDDGPEAHDHDDGGKEAMVISTTRFLDEMDDDPYPRRRRRSLTVNAVDVDQHIEREHISSPFKVSFDIGFQVDRPSATKHRAQRSRRSERQKRRRSSSSSTSTASSQRARKTEGRRSSRSKKAKERRSKSGRRRRRSKSKRKEAAVRALDAETLKTLHVDVSAAVDVERARNAKRRRKRKTAKKHRECCPLSRCSKTKRPRARRSFPHSKSTKTGRGKKPQSMPCSPIAIVESDAFRGRDARRTRYCGHHQVAIPPPPIRKRSSLELI